ncbi:MAG: WD40 repeat domain-containing protein [Clostridia bacterium]|nr:WD40 repeat domain-containing protein [Clostridia bacterium]
MKKFKQTITLLIALLIIFCYAACGLPTEPIETESSPRETIAPTQIKDPYEGYFGMDKRFSGGEGVEGINLYGVSALNNSEQTRIVLEFYDGSRAGGTEMEAPADMLPTYDISMLLSPYRIAIELKGVEYLDYESNMSIAGNALLKAIFVCDTLSKTQEDSEQTLKRTIYLQFDKGIRYNVAEEDNKLVINIKEYSDPIALQSNWYVVVNAMQEYLAGTLNGYEGFSPVLCSNLRDDLIISTPFASEVDAKNKGDAFLADNPDLSSARIQVIELAYGEFPRYTVDFANAEAYGYSVLRIDGAESVSEIVLPDSVYLCDNPINGGILFAKQKDGGADGKHIYEELWTMDKDGVSTKISEIDFYTIETVLYAPNGRYFALVERTSSGGKLYIFNGYTNELMVNLSNVGFGTMISELAWDEFSTKLYAIGGSSSISIHEYDLALYNANNRYNEVYSDILDEGGLACVNGRIYFTRSSLDSGAWIYSVMAAGGSAMPFAKGSSFKLSLDRSVMAYVNTGDYLGDGEIDTNVYFINMKTGEKEQFDAGFGVYDMIWSYDGSKLFYFEGSSEDETSTGEETEGIDDYPYTLWVYDLKSKTVTELCDVRSTNIAASGREDVLYMLFNGYTEGSVRATYKLLYTELPGGTDEE